MPRQLSTLLIAGALLFEFGCARHAPARLAAHFEAAPRPIATPAASDAPLTTTNVRLSQVDNWPGNETSISIDPNNPLHILAASRGEPGGFPVNQHYASLDGGQTWTQGTVLAQLNFSASSDPSVAYCGDGRAYYASLIGATLSSSFRSGIIVDWSTDGGVTWLEENRSLLVDRKTTSFADITDKPWIACDTTNSAYSGRLYVGYQEPLQTGTTKIKVKRSTDHGVTWSAPVVVSDADGAAQQIAIGPGGELYVSYFGDSASNTSGPILFDKSTDGGVTFGSDITAVTEVDPQGGQPFNILQSMGADRSSGPYRGNIYIAFPDHRYGDNDILLVRSTDGGTTWSAPIRVNDDPIGNGADQWQEGLTVDPLGRVIVTFYDRRRYAGTGRYEFWGAISRDGGQTFDTNFLIADTPSDVELNTFMGDYTSVAATSTHLYAVWTDRRPGLAAPPQVFSDAFPNTFRYDEVRNVVWTSGSQMSFNAQDARFGVNLDYDVLGGLISELRTDLGFTHAGCVAAAWPAPPLVDSRVPPGADGYYYLVRVHGPAGVGTYGDAWPARPNPRDALDETLVTCP